MTKVAESKSVASAAKTNTPFFNKGDSNALSLADNENSFFSKQASIPSLQAKLIIGPPNDKYEKEADTVADKVVQRLATPDVSSKKETSLQAKPITTSITPFVQTKCESCENEEKLQKKEDDVTQESPLSLQRKPIFESNAESPPDDEKNVQRKCVACEEKEKIQKQTASGNSETAPDVEKNLNASKGSGSPLSSATREKMEEAIGADFSKVRVHTDSSAAKMSADLGAHAFAHGNDIYFNSGKYDPNSKEGNHLLAHELTHTVQQGGSAIQQKKQTTAEADTFSKTDQPQVQGAWYNVDIPFTDYQFDPSFEGVKTAAGIVSDKAKEGATWAKDKIVEGFEWIVDQIASLVDSGKNYLIEKFEEIREFAGSVFDDIKNGLKSLMGMITNPITMLTNAMISLNVSLLKTGWSFLVIGAKTMWSSMKMIINGILSVGAGLWKTVSGFIGGIFNSIESLMNSRVFNLLPDFLIGKAQKLFNGLKTFWNSIRSFWDNLLKRVNTFVNKLLASIEKFVARILSYAINGLIKIVTTLKQAYDLIKAVTTDPESVLRPISDQIAGNINSEAPGKAKEIGKQKHDEFLGGAQASTGTATLIQRSPNGTEDRRTATRAETNDALIANIVEQWGQLNIKNMLWDTFVNLFWPPATIKAIGHEVHELIHNDWAKAIDNFFTPRSIMDDPVGFFHDVWSNILVVLEFPWALWRKLNSILMLLMGYMTILLILVGTIGGAIAGGPPGALAGAIAGAKLAWAVGEVLFLSYVLAESSYVLKIFLELYTARQTKTERNRDYAQMAASTIGLGIAVVVALIFFLLGALVSKVTAFLKGKTPPAVKPPEPPKPDTPTTEPPKTEPPKTEPPKEEPPKTEANPLEAIKAAVRARLLTLREKLGRIRQQVDDIPETVKEKQAVKENVNKAAEKLDKLEKDVADSTSPEEVQIIEEELSTFEKKDLRELQNQANGTNIPLATPEEQVLIDQYTNAIQRLRQATETIKAGGEEPVIKNAQAERAQALEQLDAIETRAINEHNVPGSKINRLADHIDSMTRERINIEQNTGAGDPSIGLSFATCDAVAAIKTLPGGSLKGLSYGEIQAALGKPSNVTGTLPDAMGNQTGAVRIEWNFADGSRIHVDVPGPGNSSPYAVNRGPHAGLNAPAKSAQFPNSNQAFALSEQGTVVPGNSASAHTPVKGDGALTFLLNGRERR